jgi:hypothetical protein
LSRNYPLLQCPDWLFKLRCISEQKTRIDVLPSVFGSLMDPFRFSFDVINRKPISCRYKQAHTWKILIAALPIDDILQGLALDIAK